MKRNGFTLVEMIVVIAILLIIGGFSAWLLKSSSQGLSSVTRKAPLQRDIQTALQAVEGDLLSAPKSSIGNMLPDLGFEQVPPALSTAPAADQWSWTPRPAPLAQALGIGAERLFFVHYDSSIVWRGRASLLMTVGRSIFPENVDSPDFVLVPGNYSLTARVRNPWPGLQKAHMVLQKYPGPADSILVISPFVPGSKNWFLVRSTFAVANTDTYRLQLRHAGAVSAAINDHSIWYDQVALAPLSIDLTPGVGQLDFQRFDVTTARYLPSRYWLVPTGGSGRLVRQKLMPNNTWQALGGDLPNIRRLNLTWANGSGGGPGTGRPLILTLESGPVGATGEDFLLIKSTLYPPLP